jgi:hypothetical protein
LGFLSAIASTLSSWTRLHCTQTLDLVLNPAKVHFGLYAEGVKHIHLHVFPRMPTMPAGNIPITFLQVWYKFLVYLRLKQPFFDTTVADVAMQLRHAFQTLA